MANMRQRITFKKAQEMMPGEVGRVGGIARQNIGCIFLTFRAQKSNPGGFYGPPSPIFVCVFFLSQNIELFDLWAIEHLHFPVCLYGNFCCFIASCQKEYCAFLFYYIFTTVSLPVLAFLSVRVGSQRHQKVIFKDLHPIHPSIHPSSQSSIHMTVMLEGFHVL